MLDKRIGLYDGEEPLCCAVSGELVRGRPSSQYPLDTQHYYRVLAKREAGFDGEPRATLEAELKAVIASGTAAEDAPKSFPVIAEAPAFRARRAGEDKES